MEKKDKGALQKRAGQPKRYRSQTGNTEVNRINGRPSNIDKGLRESRTPHDLTKGRNRKKGNSGVNEHHHNQCAKVREEAFSGLAHHHFSEEISKDQPRSHGFKIA